MKTGKASWCAEVAVRVSVKLGEIATGEYSEKGVQRRLREAENDLASLQRAIEVELCGYEED